METDPDDKFFTLEQELLDTGYKITAILQKNQKLANRLAEKNGEEYFVKAVLKRLLFTDKALRTAINREIMIANKVKGNFSYLVGFSEFFYTKNYAVFVYEHYEMGTIQKVYGSLKMSLLEITILMRDLFLGLEELKYLKIVHKNLNEDVIFVSKGNLKIGGYEYCDNNDCHKMEEFDHNYLLGVIEQNLQTSPPEVINNKLCGVKTPLYSFGAIFYRLIHGRYPTDILTVREIKDFFASNMKITEFRSDLPPEFLFILKNALEANYEYRLSPSELRSEIGYLYGFCKGKEEQLRSNIFERRQFYPVEGQVDYEASLDYAKLQSNRNPKRKGKGNQNPNEKRSVETSSFIERISSPNHLQEDNSKNQQMTSVRRSREGPSRMTRFGELALRRKQNLNFTSVRPGLGKLSQSETSYYEDSNYYHNSRGTDSIIGNNPIEIGVRD